MGFKTPGSTPGRISEKMEVNLICKLYSRLENSVEKGARQATGHGVAELDMTERLTHTHTHTHTRRILGAADSVSFWRYPHTRRECSRPSKISDSEMSKMVGGLRKRETQTRR